MQRNANIFTPCTPFEIGCPCIVSQLGADVDCPSCLGDGVVMTGWGLSLVEFAKRYLVVVGNRIYQVGDRSPEQQKEDLYKRRQVMLKMQPNACYHCGTLVTLDAGRGWVHAWSQLHECMVASANHVASPTALAQTPGSNPKPDPMKREG